MAGKKLRAEASPEICHLSSSGYSGGAVPEFHRDSLSQWRSLNRTPATTQPCGHRLILNRPQACVKKSVARNFD